MIPSAVLGIVAILDFWPALLAVYLIEQDEVYSNAQRLKDIIYLCTDSSSRLLFVVVRIGALVVVKDSCLVVDSLLPGIANERRLPAILFGLCYFVCVMLSCCCCCIES